MMKIRENDRKPSTIHNPRVREVGKGDGAGEGQVGEDGESEVPEHRDLKKKVREL